MSPLIGSNESVASVSLAPIGGNYIETSVANDNQLFCTDNSAGANSILETLVVPATYSEAAGDC